MKKKDEKEKKKNRNFFEDFYSLCSGKEGGKRGRYLKRPKMGEREGRLLASNAVTEEKRGKAVRIEGQKVRGREKKKKGVAQMLCVLDLSPRRRGGGREERGTEASTHEKGRDGGKRDGGRKKA